MSRLREIAKFACGFEAFHVVAHTYLWLSGTALTVLGFTLTPTWNLVSAIINAIVAVGLGMYGWRSPGMPLAAHLVDSLLPTGAAVMPPGEELTARAATRF